MTKLCKDCKHYKKDWISHILSFGITVGNNGEYDMCGRKKNNNLVTGRDKPSFCEIERRDWYSLDVCGVDGKYFEARK